MNKSKIQMLINTLNQITVSGKANMDMLLGCIFTLEEMLSEQEPPIENNGEAVTDNG